MPAPAPDAPSITHAPLDILSSSPLPPHLNALLSLFQQHQSQLKQQPLASTSKSKYKSKSRSNSKPGEGASDDEDDDDEEEEENLDLDWRAEMGRKRKRVRRDKGGEGEGREGEGVDLEDKILKEAAQIRTHLSHLKTLLTAPPSSSSTHSSLPGGHLSVEQIEEGIRRMDGEVLRNKEILKKFAAMDTPATDSILSGSSLGQAEEVGLGSGGGMKVETGAGAEGRS